MHATNGRMYKSVLRKVVACVMSRFLLVLLALLEEAGDPAGLMASLARSPPSGSIGRTIFENP